MIPEVMPLHYGKVTSGLPRAARRYSIFNDDDKEVGVVFPDDQSGMYEAALFGHEPRFSSFKIDQLLVVCGLWLAYQELVKIP